MIQKIQEKKRAVALRKAGKTYSEILSSITVSKSTLSLWLHEVQLANKQVQRITEKKKASQLKGAKVRHQQRVTETTSIYGSAVKELGVFTERDLFILGIALYWAEGTKEYEDGKTVMLEFANSNPDMISLFIQWLLVFGGVKKSDITIRLHIHESHAPREKDIQSYWSKVTGVSHTQFAKTNFKKHIVKTKHAHSAEEYKGLVAIRVQKSTTLNRRVQGLIYAIIAGHKNCQIV